MVNEWTREDLPTVNDLVEVSRESLFAGRTDGGVAVLDAVAAHLNAHHPKPEFEGYCTCNGYNSGGLMGDCGVALHRAQYRAGRVEADRDRWRRAHEIVEQERDQARDRCRELERERDAAVRQGELKARTERELAEAAEADRDGWKARALDAEHYAQAASDSNRDNADRASKAERDRDVWKARADKWHGAWQKSAPDRTVTRADIEKAIRGKVWAANREPNKAGFHRVHVDWATDAVWSLVSGSDPAVFVVRESDIAAVEVAHDERGWHARGATWSHEPTADGVRDGAMRHLRDVAKYEALARAIEAERATDPVEEKAREYLTVMFDYEEPDSASPAEWKAATQMARHVLGQEASDGR